jgi:leader peptidase (prepilin peptidase)/N-methyltransferase
LSVPNLLLAAYAVALGLVLGSFLAAVTWRWPRRESVGLARSRCPACGARIRARDLVPVLSWLRLRGRCASCKGPISPRYPLIEAALGGIALLAVLRFGWAWQALAALGLGMVALGGAVLALEGPPGRARAAALLPAALAAIAFAALFRCS